MVSHLKPDCEAGVHIFSMAYGALTFPVLSHSKYPLIGREGSSSTPGLRSAAPQGGGCDV